MFKALARNVMGKSGNPAEKLEKICKETGNVEKLDALLNSHPAELFLNVRFVSSSVVKFVLLLATMCSKVSQRCIWRLGTTFHNASSYC